MNVYVVVLNWNEKLLTEKCVKSLLDQSLKPEIIIVDNGSTDGSYDYLSKKFPELVILRNDSNLGFSGGENRGIKYCLENSSDYIALLNNDAKVEKDWLKILVSKLEKNNSLGTAGGILLRSDGQKIDSTSDQYSIWGLPIARQRNENRERALAKEEKVFGTTAGACVYRAKALEDVGLFDEKFFAYYEDTDLNLRLQLKGWESVYEPTAIGYHEIGGTSGKIAGFTTYQTMKNLPMVFWKNVPLGLMPKMLPRFTMAYTLILLNSLTKSSRAWPALKGFFMTFVNIPHVMVSRYKIQRSKTVKSDYLWSILYKDLPPDAERLRRFRRFFTGKN